MTMAAKSKVDMLNLLEAASIKKHTNSLDHLANCLHVLKNCHDISDFTYKFFQELNASCLEVVSEQCDIILANQYSLSTVEHDILNKTTESEDTGSVFIFKQISMELFTILCKKSNLNLNVMKMVSKTLMVSLLLSCSKLAIIKFIIKIIKLDDSNSSITLVWTNDETPNQSNMISIAVDAMAPLKIMLAAGICEKDNSWLVPEYWDLIDLIISTLCSYCSNKYLRHLVFSLQTLKIVVDDSVKYNHPVETHLQNDIFNAILGNWENYIPSVMDQNLVLCESFIKCYKQGDEKVQMEKFWHFLTNVSCTLKSKYYMMAACFLADFYPMHLFLPDSWFVKNLVYSLSRSYLVTAGAYCHKVLAKNILNDVLWKKIFLDQVIELVCHTDISIRQNVCNYWLPAAVKQYPNIMETLYNKVVIKYKLVQSQCENQLERHYKNRDIDQHQRHLHAIILMIKLERPARFSSNEKYAFVQKALVCSNEMIRGDAFLCCQTFNRAKSHVAMQREGTAVESCQFFKDIRSFLEENINCDDATLRQTVYKVFKNYVVNTECQFRSCAVPLDLTVRLKNGTTVPYPLPDFMDMYIEQYTQLYEFLRDNLCTGANYQRLITTLNLLNILFENIQHLMTENQKKKRMLTKDYLKSIGKWQFESSSLRGRVFNCLKDDTNDVRLMAKHLLITYFGFTKDESRAFQENLLSSLEMSKSNVFYIAESGAYAVGVLANFYYKSESLRSVLALKELLQTAETEAGVDSVYNALEKLELTLEDRNSQFSNHYLHQCHVQSRCLQSDILLAVKNKNSLHGALTTLMLLITDPASPEFCALNLQQVDGLLNLLNETCLYLLDILCMKSKSTNFAPSFGEMGEAMVSLIQNAFEADDTEKLTMSPAHQALFNCIWMNLKICCTFASELAVAYAGKLSRDQVVFACGIVSHVLHRCRHKGAIQNAGLALANIVSKCLYEDTYPLDLLQNTMKSVFDCPLGGTVSRKSAGVAILVHKILSSSHSMKNILFVTAMDRIIQVASSHVETSEETLKVDLPQAIAFHMLQFLVADSSLRVQMAEYLEIVTIVCFDKMQCQEWTVRNAALQVFGVLLPKLVGTKKQDSENQSSNVAFEEFFYQLPRIGDGLRSLLSTLEGRNTCVIVSVLTLLSRLKVTGDLMQQNGKSNDLKHFFSDVYNILLSLNIHTIRFQAANCYVNSVHSHAELQNHFNWLLFSSLEFIVGLQALKAYFKSEIMSSFLKSEFFPKRLRIVNENQLHGILLTLDILKERIYLENLKLDEHFLSDLLHLLSIENPCTILARPINYSTYSLIFKMFQYENKTPGPVLSPRIDFLHSLSGTNEDFQKQIGWKLLVQEVWKFHMFKSLFIENRIDLTTSSGLCSPNHRIDFHYIEYVVDCLWNESDILKKVLEHLIILLQDYSKSHMYFSENRTERARNESTLSARLSIWNMLNTVVDSEMNKECAEQVFHVVVQIYNMFIEDDHLAACAENDHDFLSLGSEIFDKYYSLDAVGYTPPSGLPMLALCLVLSRKEADISNDCYTRKTLPSVVKIWKLFNFIADEDTNEAFRLNVAIAMSILIRSREFQLIYFKEMMVLAIELLQDEVHGVRQEIIYFLRQSARREFESITCEGPLILKNPYRYLLEITTNNSRISFVAQLSILCDLLFLTEEDLEPEEADAEFSNPFDHNMQNFYSEPVFVTRYVSSRLKQLLISLEIQNLPAVSLQVLLKTLNKHLEEYSKHFRLNEHGKMKVAILEKSAKALNNHLNKGLVELYFT